ncbi:MAG: hypothetical protein NVV59_04735 [Chitinophagaceae bacterium]|nr:hypothetical protein [Chitinophagaceae bacterium]
MVNLLYTASNAGVQIQLLVRGICRLKPGVKNQSENIEVKRIVDRYLEHGRIFYFYNDGKPLLLAGSADWMERNIHRRIEVCFPVSDPLHQNMLIEIMNLQWSDNVKATAIDTSTLSYAERNKAAIRSQEEIWKRIKNA